MDFNIFGILATPTIAVICYLLGMAIKVSKIDDKYIPVACGLFGAILGVVAYVCGMSGFPATDVLTAIAIGIVSGLASTGANQIYKQLKKEEK